jgi:hypothetical protein
LAIPERLVVPAVPVVLVALLLPLPALALVRMNFGSVLLAVDEVVPVVPVGLACARCTQPVTVIVFGVLCDDVSCARTTAVHAIDANSADNTLSFICPPADRSAVATATLRPIVAPLFVASDREPMQLSSVARVVGGFAACKICL